MSTQNELRIVKLSSEGAANMIGGFVGNLNLAVHTAKHPTPNEWTNYLTSFSAETATGILVYSAGGGPNALQRQESAEFFKKATFSPPVAVLTASTFIRGVTTALAWVGVQSLRAFKPQDVGAGLAYLKSPLEPQLVAQYIGRLAEIVGMKYDFPSERRNAS